MTLTLGNSYALHVRQVIPVERARRDVLVLHGPRRVRDADEHGFAEGRLHDELLLDAEDGRLLARGLVQELPYFVLQLRRTGAPYDAHRRHLDDPRRDLGGHLLRTK